MVLTMRLLEMATMIGWLMAFSTICNAAAAVGQSNLVNTSSLQFKPAIIDDPTTGTRFILADNFKADDPLRRWIPKISYDPRTERRLVNHESFDRCLELWRGLIGGEGEPTDLDRSGITNSSYGFWLAITVRRPFPSRSDEIAALNAVSQNLNHFLDPDRDPDWGYRPLKIRMLSSPAMGAFRLLGEMRIGYDPDWQPQSLEGPSVNQTGTTKIPDDGTVQVARSRRRSRSNPAVTNISGSLPASLGQPKILNATLPHNTSLGFLPFSIDDSRTGIHLVFIDKLDLNNPMWLPKVSRSPIPVPGAVNEESLEDCLREWRQRLLQDGPPEELAEDPWSVESYGYNIDIAPMAPYARYLDEAAAIDHVIGNLHEFLETVFPTPGPMSWYRPIQVEISRTAQPGQVLAVVEITFDPNWQPLDGSLELPLANHTISTSVQDGADLT